MLASLKCATYVLDEWRQGCLVFFSEHLGDSPNSINNKEDKRLYKVREDEGGDGRSGLNSLNSRLDLVMLRNAVEMGNE